MPEWVVHTGDCREVMAAMDESSVDSIVTDPPYGLSFMGKDWDRGVPGVEFWVQALRVAKPGAHLLAFGGTRMVHHLATAIEDAGWDIDDAFGFNGMAGHWTSATTQPSVPTLDQVPTLLGLLGDPEVPERVRELIVDLNGAKGQPGAAWFDREVVESRVMADTTRVRAGFMGRTHSGDAAGSVRMVDITAPATEAAKTWEGWGTALKPAVEPIVVARKPLVGTVAANVLAHGTGALNIDGCRIGFMDAADEAESKSKNQHTQYQNPNSNRDSYSGSMPPRTDYDAVGRWPANLIHDGSDEATAGMGLCGEAARYFYCPKAGSDDREDGNAHPTVKPTELMAYLCRLVTPPGRTVLDPFNGSGSTGKAAVRGGFGYIGIELDPEYAAIARCRIGSEALASTGGDGEQFGLFAPSVVEAGSGDGVGRGGGLFEEGLIDDGDRDESAGGATPGSGGDHV